MISIYRDFIVIHSLNNKINDHLNRLETRMIAFIQSATGNTNKIKYPFLQWCTTNFSLETGFNIFHFNCYLFQLTKKNPNISYAFKSHIYPLIYVCKHMLVSHIFHTAQTDQYPRTYPLILTYSYISRRWDKWNEVFQGEEKSHGSFTNTYHFPLLLNCWHYRSKKNL